MNHYIQWFYRIFLKQRKSEAFAGRLYSGCAGRADRWGEQ